MAKHVTLTAQKAVNSNDVYRKFVRKRVYREQMFWYNKFK